MDLQTLQSRIYQGINLLLFVVLLYFNFTFGSHIGPVSKQHDVPITPAPYTFSIWFVIYILITVMLITDYFYAEYSIFEKSPRSTLLRQTFALSCLANMSWVILFPNGYILTSTIPVFLLFLCLAVIYIHIIIYRTHHRFNLKQYVCSELPLTIYFAWACIATVISIGLAIQEWTGKPLSLSNCIALLALSLVAALSAVWYKQDIAIGLVVLWAFVGVAIKYSEKPREPAKALAVRSCATFGAAVLVSVTCLHLILTRFDWTVEEALPEKKEKFPANYGSTK